MKTFKRTIIIFAMALLLQTGLQGIGKASAAYNPNSKSHVVYYVPHQDDELLSFGVSIMNHLKGGHNVHVVLMTDGAGSNVRKKLNMTEAQFSAARNKEFAYSLAVMGVKEENIEYKKIKDGHLTLAQAETIIKGYEKKYPKAKHKAFSYTDPHTDHNITGKALEKLRKAKIVTDARYYVKGSDNPKGKRLIKERFSEEYRPFLVAASGAYNIKNETLGFYGIGHRSVKQSFRVFEAQPVSRYHK